MTIAEEKRFDLISRWGTQAKRALNVVRIDKQNTGLIHVTNLFPYFLNPLFPLPKWPHAQNPCPIRLSAGGGGLNPLHSTLPASLSLSSYLKFVTNLASQRLIVLTSLNTTQANGL